MITLCSQCTKKNNKLCTEPCEEFKNWRKNPEAFEKKLKENELPNGVYWVTLNLIRDDVCAQDCMDLSRTMKVRSDRLMSEIDDELKKRWLPKGYNWKGGSRLGTVGEYVKASAYHTGTLRYTHR